MNSSNKVILFLLFIFIFLPVVSAGTEIFIQKAPIEEMSIGQFQEVAHIIKNDVDIEYGIEINIYNYSSVRNQIIIDFSFVKAQDQFFTPDTLSLTACQKEKNDSNGLGMNFSYKTTLDNCNYTIPINITSMNRGYRLYINKEDVIENHPYSTTFYLIAKFHYPNFIIERTDQKIFWHDLNIDPRPLFIQRYLIPEEDVMINSLLNYKIWRYSFDSNKFILSTDNLDDAQLFYKNGSEEIQKRNTRDWIIIVLSLSFSIIFGFISSQDNTSRRTKNLWVIAGALLLFRAFVLFKAITNSTIIILSQIAILIFIATVILASISYKRDNPRVTIRGNIRSIWRLIKSLFV